MSAVCTVRPSFARGCRHIRPNPRFSVLLRELDQWARLRVTGVGECNTMFAVFQSRCDVGNLVQLIADVAGHVFRVDFQKHMCAPLRSCIQ